MKIHTLLVEADAVAATLLGDYLESHGHVVDYAVRGSCAMRLAAVHAFETIVLSDRRNVADRGFETCRRLRASLDRPPIILMLGQDASLSSTLMAFEAGADDYMAQPAAMAEIRARLHALLKRRQGACADDILRIGDLEFDPRAMQARRQGRLLALTSMQLKLLRLLMEASPGVVSYADLDMCLWAGDLDSMSESLLRSHIRNLRAIVDKPFPERLIETRRNRGYRIARSG